MRWRQVCSLRFTFVRLDHFLEVSDLPQGFLHSKTSQPYVWEEILLVKTISLINYRILFHRNVILKTISQLKAAKYEMQKPSTCRATLFRCKFSSMFSVFHLAWSTWTATKTFVAGWTNSRRKLATKQFARQVEGFCISYFAALKQKWTHEWKQKWQPAINPRIYLYLYLRSLVFTLSKNVEIDLVRMSNVETALSLKQKEKLLAVINIYLIVLSWSSDCRSRYI